VKYLKLGILHPVQQHVHTGQVVGGDIFFLAENFADPMYAHLMTDIEQQGAGTAGKIQQVFEFFLLSGAGVLAIKGDDG